MSDVELRPCPFCGNKDIETKSSPWLVDDFIVWASCSQCGASVEKENGDMDGVIAAWNRRATDEREALRDDLEAWAADYRKPFYDYAYGVSKCIFCRKWVDKSNDKGHAPGCLHERVKGMKVHDD